MKKFAALFFAFTATALAWDDPTGGKPFLPWVWEENLKPTLKKSVDGHGVTMLAAGTGMTFAVRAYDHKIYDHNKVHHDLLIGKNEAITFGKMGNGVLGISLAGAQLVFDQKNGIKTMRAMLLAASSHVTISAMTRRNRPENRTDFLPWPSSFPSGHTTNAFALAGSFAWSYGWPIGVPAYTIASAIALSRVKEERHWASDVVAGLVVGTFWARASFRADDNPKEAMIVPVPIGDGMMLAAVKEWD